MSRRLQVTLRGRDAHLGEVAASDLAQLLLLTQSALVRTAGHVTGQLVKPTGRWRAGIEAATRLSLVALESGSVRAVLELPAPVDSAASLELGDARLGEVAFDVLTEVVRGATERSMPDVASTLVRMGDRLGLGVRFDSIEFGDPDGGASLLDVKARERLRTAVAADGLPGNGHVVGVLYEADFEASRARLRLSGTREHVVVDFDEGLADDIQAALRHQASLIGEVTIDPRHNRAAGVRLREITVAEQLVAGAEDFWRETDVAMLAQEQGVSPPADDWSRYRDSGASDEEIDDVLEFLTT